MVFPYIIVYVDDLNFIGTPEELTKTTSYLKKEFKMKDIGKTKFCLDLHIKHFREGIFLHQKMYTKRILKHFYMDKAHQLTSWMVVRSLDVKKDHFRLPEEGEELLNFKVPYLSAIGVLTYLVNCTRSDIAFSVNLLARYNLPQLEGIRMVSNTYFAIYIEQLIWFILHPKNRSHL